MPWIANVILSSSTSAVFPANVPYQVCIFEGTYATTFRSIHHGLRSEQQSMTALRIFECLYRVTKQFSYCTLYINPIDNNNVRYEIKISIYPSMNEIKTLKINMHLMRIPV